MSIIHKVRIIIVLFSLFALSAIISCYTLSFNKETINSQIFEYNERELFKAWHTLYDKKYKIESVYGEERFLIFLDNIKSIRTQLMDPNKSFKIGLNAFSDQTLDELAVKYLDLSMHKFVKKKFLMHPELELLSLLDSSSNKPSFEPIDWRDADIFLPVRDQKDCGGCWAFASLGAIEALRKLKGKGNNNYLSVQQLIDCDSKEKGCKGGWPSMAYNYLGKNGSVLDSDYPYKALNDVCKSEVVSHNVVARIETSIDSCEEDECLTNGYQYKLLKNGPMATVIDAYNTLFFNYKSGIYSEECAEPNHAIILVGFGVDAKTKEEYWIIRNSWGSDWGMNGYGYVKHNPQNYLSCNINRYGFQPRIIE